MARSIRYILTLTDKYTLTIPIGMYRVYKDKYPLHPFFDSLNEEDLQRLYQFEQEILTPEENIIVHYSDISFKYGDILLQMIDYILENYPCFQIYIKTLTQIKEIITYFQKS